MREETKSIEQLKEETAREFEKVYNEENPLRTANSGEETENIKSLLLSSQQQAYNLAMERAIEAIKNTNLKTEEIISSLTTDKNIT